MSSSKPASKPLRASTRERVTRAPGPAAAARAAMPSADVRALTVRLRRAEGQVRAVARLIEEGESCEAVAQQLTAARRALDRAFFALVGCAVQHGQVGSGEVAGLLAKYA